jgi:hypothetical protein
VKINRRTAAAAAGLVLAAGLGLGMTAPASASVDPEAGVASAAITAQSATTMRTSNWAGYMAYGGSFARVSAVVTVPTLNCRKTPSDGYPNGYPATDMWVALGGYHSNSEGTLLSATCEGAVPGPWYPSLGGYEDAKFTHVRPGDHVYMAVSYSHGVYSFSLRDYTNGSHDVVSGAVSGAGRTSAEAIITQGQEADGSGWITDPLADSAANQFAKVSVSSVSGNGHTSSLTSRSWKTAKVIMAHGGTVNEMPSSLSHGGSQFTVKWLATTRGSSNRRTRAGSHTRPGSSPRIGQQRSAAEDTDRLHGVVSRLACAAGIDLLRDGCRGRRPASGGSSLDVLRSVRRLGERQMVDR